MNNDKVHHFIYLFFGSAWLFDVHLLLAVFVGSGLILAKEVWDHVKPLANEASRNSPTEHILDALAGFAGMGAAFLENML